MGLLEGRNALIFGVANDHSIAWGIARALHAEGAEVGFSSVESLIEKRVRPLAESLGSTFVEPCDVQRDEDIERVFARWRESHDGLDILVHALAFAKREDLSGRFVDTSRDGFALAHDVSAYSLVGADPRRPAAAPRRVVDPDPDLLRRREGRRELQRDGRRQGRPRGVGPLPRRGPRAGTGSGSTRSAPARSGRWRRRASAASRRCTASSPTSRRCARTSRSRTSGETAVYLASDLSSAVTGEVIYVDGGFSVLGRADARAEPARASARAGEVLRHRGVVDLRPLGDQVCVVATRAVVDVDPGRLGAIDEDRLEPSRPRLWSPSS